MEHRKGVRILIKAAIELLTNRKRQDVCLLLTGNMDNQSERFEKMYAGFGIESLIKFGGYRRDLAMIHCGCFCGVIPSTGWDSFTITSIKMAASGLPVIASRLQGLAEAIIDKKTGLLFEPGNFVQLADYIEFLLDNPSLAKEYGRQGRLRCETELSLDCQKQRFIEVLLKRMA
jgi:glycosyltransferase involved in cell wall biosynthesis